MKRTRQRTPAADRFWSKVDKTGDCWLWTGYSQRGYGFFNAGERTPVLAHRWVYTEYVGPIPDGLQIDHLCRVRGCVNPAHLEAVTAAENMRRMFEAMTHCKRGHPYESDTSARRCRTCKNAGKRASYHAMRARARTEAA